MSDKIEIFSTSALVDLKMELETASELTDQQKDDFLKAIIELVDEFEKYMLNEANSIENEIVEKYMTDEPYDPLTHELEMQHKQQLLDAVKGLMDEEKEEDYYLAETKVPYLKVSRKVCNSTLET
tara:strand:+ start:1231 stop:1605 length:375 start_codon:yes stop_codon:yes gene_type:complete